MALKPEFIGFDCYGTLINVERGPAANCLFENCVRRLPGLPGL